jgi:hypothetical protein
VPSKGPRGKSEVFGIDVPNGSLFQICFLITIDGGKDHWTDEGIDEGYLHN